MPNDAPAQGEPTLLNFIETDEFPSSFPGGDGLRQGRSPRDGYARGWGLEFGGLTPVVLTDPLYQECYSLAEGRTIQATPCRLNLYLLVRYYLPRLGSGAIVEFGSYRGGSAIFLAALCHRLGLDIKVYGLDTFAGMPTTDTAIDAHHAGDFEDTSLEELRAYVSQSGLDQRLTFVQGRFDETTPAVLRECGPVLLAHIDCDIQSAVAYAYDAVKPRMAEGGYIVFDDAHSPSCLGATEAVEDLVIRRDGLSCEQIAPHFVFRIWRDHPHPHAGPREQALGSEGEARRIQDAESQLGAARETLAQLWHDYDALRPFQAKFQEEIQLRAELEQRHEALHSQYSELLAEHSILQQQVAMASRSRWCALGRLFGVGPRFE